MKICVFSRSIPVHSIGGMENHCWTVCVSFSQKGHKVTLITTSHPQDIEHQIVNDNFEVFYLKGTKPGKYSRQWWKKSLEKFLELNSNEEFDAIFSESSGALSVLKYKVRHNLKIPIVFRMPGTAIRDAISQLKQKISIRSILSAIKNFIFSFRDKRWIKLTDAVITCSDEVTNSIIEHLKVPKEKVYTILNGVDTDLFNPEIDTLSLKRELDIPEESKIISCVTRLKKEKGIHTLLKSFQKITTQKPDIFLIIVGSGNYQDELKKLSKKLNIENKVKFVGEITHENLPQYYAFSDIFVLPTLAKEGLPWTVIEAMSCGKPVIASEIGGIPQMIKDGINGLLVEPGNVKKLTEKISFLLDNKETREKLSKNAREFVVKNLSQEKMINETFDIISKCIKKI